MKDVSDRAASRCCLRTLNKIGARQLAPATVQTRRRSGCSNSRLPARRFSKQYDDEPDPQEIIPSAAHSWISPTRDLMVPCKSPYPSRTPRATWNSPNGRAKPNGYPQQCSGKSSPESAAGLFQACGASTADAGPALVRADSSIAAGLPQRGLSIRTQLESASRICGDGFRCARWRFGPPRFVQNRAARLHAGRHGSVAAAWRPEGVRVSQRSGWCCISLQEHGGWRRRCPPDGGRRPTQRRMRTRARAPTPRANKPELACLLLDVLRRAAMAVVDALLRHRPFELEILRGCDMFS